MDVEVLYNTVQIVQRWLVHGGVSHNKMWKWLIASSCIPVIGNHQIFLPHEPIIKRPGKITLRTLVGSLEPYWGDHTQGEIPWRTSARAVRNPLIA